MSADTRRQKRALRKQYRKEHKQAFDKFVEAIKAFMEIDLKEKLPYKQKFNQVWPALKPTIEFLIVLRVTREKFDTAANEVIILGDSLYGKDFTDQEALDFLSKLSDIWETVESVLEIFKIVVPDKTDAIIDKIIEIGDWLFE
jgi:hypothetical protein